MKVGRRAHPAFLAALAATTIAAVAVPTGMQVAQARTQQALGHMQDIAARVQDPPGVRYLPRGDCPDQTYLVRCMISQDNPDHLTDQLRAGLTSAAGHTAGVLCDSDPVRKGVRSCLIRIDDGPHAVLISIDTEGHRVNGKLVITGSRIRIDAV